MNEFDEQTEDEKALEEEVKGEKYDGGEIPRTEAVPEED